MGGEEEGRGCQELSEMGPFSCKPAPPPLPLDFFSSTLNAENASVA